MPTANHTAATSVITVPDISTHDTASKPPYHSTAAHSTDIYDRIFFLIWGLVTLWLFVAALTNQGETGDGYQSIVNTRYLVGDATFWYVQRGPLNTLLLLPAEIARQVLNLSPIDVRPFHIMTTLIHSSFLLGVWFLLRQQYPQHGQARLLVFISTLLSLMFYAWSVQISPDILPGLLFLGMILLSQRWFERRGNGTLLAIMALGIAGPLIKPTYVIFWVAIWTYAFVAFLRTILKQNGHYPHLNFDALWRLSTAGAASALAVWVAYAVHASFQNPEPFLIRPIGFTHAIFTQIDAEQLPVLFPWYIYLINLHNFGFTTLALIGGLIATKTPWLRRFFKLPIPPENKSEEITPCPSHYRFSFQVFCFLFCLVYMQMVDYREVRYLLYLTPLLALILTPTVAMLLTRIPKLQTLILLLLFIDYVRIIPFAFAQVTLGRHLNIDKLIDVAESTANTSHKVIVSPILSFALFPDSPIIGDRYHGYYHLSDLLIFTLFESRYIVQGLPPNFAIYHSLLEPGDVVIYANHQLTRNPEQPEDDAFFFDKFFQISGTVKNITLTRKGDSFYPSNTNAPLFIVPPDELKEFPVYTPDAVSVEDLTRWGWATPDDTSATILAIEIAVLCKRGWCYPIEEIQQYKSLNKAKLEVKTTTPVDAPPP